MCRLTEYTEPAHYALGRIARQDGRPKNPPATASWADRHWWLAGWNDADLELTP